MKNSISKLAMIVLQTPEEIFLNVVKRETNIFEKQWEKNIPQPEPIKPILSEKAKLVKDAIEKGDFGCRTKSVADLMSVILDETIEIETCEVKETCDFNYTTFAVVVPIEDCKPYILNQPIMIHEDNYGVIINSEDDELYNGPRLPREFKKIRPANETEIEKFVSDLYKSIKLSNEINPNVIIDNMIRNSELNYKPMDSAICEPKACCEASSLNKI